MATYRIVTITILVTILVGPPVLAQERDPKTNESGPRRSSPLEFGISIGAWNLNSGGSLVSGRVSRNHRHWIATELAVDGGRPDEWTPRYRMLTANARFSLPTPVDRRTLFVTVGAVAADGLSFRWSPMAGLGVQSGSTSDPLAVRVEFQRLTRGRGLRDSGRLLVGLALVLR